jgi:hypothetical protein
MLSKYLLHMKRFNQTVTEFLTNKAQTHFTHRYSAHPLTNQSRNALIAITIGGIPTSNPIRFYPKTPLHIPYPHPKPTKEKTLTYLKIFFKLSLHFLFPPSLSSNPANPALVTGLCAPSAPSTFNNPPLLDGLCLLFGRPNVLHLIGVCGLGVPVFGRSLGNSSGTVSGEKWIVWRERADWNGVEERAVSGERVDGRGEEKR